MHCVDICHNGLTRDGRRDEWVRSNFWGLIYEEHLVDIKSSLKG